MAEAARATMASPAHPETPPRALRDALTGVSDDPFADVPPNARGHLGLLVYAAAFALFRCLGARAGRRGLDPERVLDEFPFLAGYVAEIRQRFPADEDMSLTARRLSAAVAQWEEQRAAMLPLRRLAETLGLGREAILLLAALGLVEEDAGFAAVLAAVQTPAGLRRPTAPLLTELLGVAAPGSSPDGASLCRVLSDEALVEVVDDTQPRAEWQYRVPAAIWPALRGERSSRPLPGLQCVAAGRVPALHDLVTSASANERLGEVAEMLAAGDAEVLVIRGPAGCARAEMAGSVARGLGRDVIEVGTGIAAMAAVGPLCTLTHAMPVFAPDLGPGEMFSVPVLPGYRGPIAVVIGRDGGVSTAGTLISVELASEPPAVRLEHWRRALGAHAGPDIAEIAERFVMGGLSIRRCASNATARALAGGRKVVALDDVRRAAAELGRHTIETLAMRLEPEDGGWDRLTVPAATTADLMDLERRCRYRERLAATVGGDFPGGLNRGVRALLEGPSGTGKTLAARVLAARLGVELFRVDLAAVINKYVGETEKNLARIFARVEDLDVVLLLDEGDSLMARRTEVRSANDRYANLETNYLLQRLETYEGIVIVTTNLGAQIDPAFRRRMDVTVRFAMPDAAERWQLWCAHLGAAHGLSAAAIEDAALRYPLTGGQIRNAAAHARLTALSRDDALSESDLIAGIETEHRKSGTAFAPAQPSSDPMQGAALDAFLGATR